MKVLVTGTSGLLGSDVADELLKRGHEVIGVDRAKSNNQEYEHRILDITDATKVMKAVKEIKPDVIIHCAAWVASDAAEEPENFATVFEVNVFGTRNIAKAAKAVNAKMMYISTDYVFNGEGEKPWDPDDKNYAPINVYGQTKLAGELEVAKILKKYFIVRIAWVFGLRGRNFVDTMLELSKTHDTVCVVDDQIGTPTYTIDLARLLADMIETDKYGYYHATNEGGFISWADYTEEIYRQTGRKTKVKRVTSEEYGLNKAKRPHNSRLDKSKLEKNGFEPLPEWNDALARFLESRKSRGV